MGDGNSEFGIKQVDIRGDVSKFNPKMRSGFPPPKPQELPVAHESKTRNIKQKTSHAVRNTVAGAAILAASALGAKAAGVFESTPEPPPAAASGVTISYDNKGNEVKIVDNRNRPDVTISPVLNQPRQIDEKKIQTDPAPQVNASPKDQVPKASAVPQSPSTDRNLLQAIAKARRINIPEVPNLANKIESAFSISPIETGSRGFSDIFKSASGIELAGISRKVQYNNAEIGNIGDYASMKAFLAGWGEHLEIQAQKHGLDPDIVKALVFIESRGEINAVSDAEAVGPFQITKETGRRYGLRIDSEVDERKNPYLASIRMTEYLSDLRNIFGENMGFAVNAYNAGEGTMMEELRVYFLHTKGIDIGDYGQAVEEANAIKPDETEKIEESKRKIKGIEDKVGGLIKADKVNIHDVLEDEWVSERVLSKLRPEGRVYVYKAEAATQQFKNLKPPVQIPKFPKKERS